MCMLQSCCFPMQDGFSALIVASQEGHEQVVDVLLGHGVSPHLQTEVQ